MTNPEPDETERVKVHPVKCPKCKLADKLIPGGFNLDSVPNDCPPKGGDAA